MTTYYSFPTEFNGTFVGISEQATAATNGIKAEMSWIDSVINKMAAKQAIVEDIIIRTYLELHSECTVYDLTRYQTGELDVLKDNRAGRDIYLTKRLGSLTGDFWSATYRIVDPEVARAISWDGDM